MSTKNKNWPKHLTLHTVYKKMWKKTRPDFTNKNTMNPQQPSEKSYFTKKVTTQVRTVNDRNNNETQVTKISKTLRTQNIRRWPDNQNKKGNTKKASWADLFSLKIAIREFKQRLVVLTHTRVGSAGLQTRHQAEPASFYEQASKRWEENLIVDRKLESTYLDQRLS